MMETMLRTQILLLCLLLLGFCYAATTWKPLFGGSGATLSLRLYHLFILFTTIMLVTDLLGWLFDGVEGRFVHGLLLAIHTIYYAVHSLPTICYILYAELLLYQNPQRLRRWKLPLMALSSLLALGSIASGITGWFFSVDAQNVYSRGTWFIGYAVVQLLLLGASLIPLIGAARKSTARTYWTLVFFPVIAFAGGLLQSLVYGLVLIWPVTTVFLVAAALNIQKNQIGIDHLTGISNRLWFDEMLGHSFHQQQRFGCILMDLDGFKQINDTLGHDAGDLALQEMARILRRVAGPKDTVARYGGDEFAILMHEASEYHLQELVSRIELEVAMSNQASKRGYLLSVSMGYALYDSTHFSDAMTFMAHIDASMYAHKRSKLGNRL
ncbi:MAG: GGDEF domain-containing protein [Spirochaetales bacterium]|nr:GGDEF domain-containing protein [Spirochaetales bacterium]